MNMTCAVTVMSLALTVALVPRIHWYILKGERVALNRGEMGAILGRQARVLRHQKYGLAALLLVWPIRFLAGGEAPAVATALASSYAASSLFLAILEGALAQKIDDLLAQPAMAGEGAPLPAGISVQHPLHHAAQQVCEVYRAEHDQSYVHKPRPDRVGNKRRPAEIVIEIPRG